MRRDEGQNGVEARQTRRKSGTDDAIGIAVKCGGPGMILRALPREIDSDERRDGTTPS